MKTRLQNIINVCGIVLVGIGCILFTFAFAIEAAESNTSAFTVFNVVFMMGDFSLLLSIVLIVIGVVLFSIEIIPSRNEQRAVDALKIRYVLGEITKQQYDLLTKELNA